MEFRKMNKPCKKQKTYGFFLRLKYCDRLYYRSRNYFLFWSCLVFKYGNTQAIFCSSQNCFCSCSSFPQMTYDFCFFPFAYADFSSKSKPENTPTEKAKKQETGPVACCSSRADEPSHMTWREHNRIMAASSFCSPMTLLNIKSILTSDDCPMPTFALYLNWELNKSAIPVKWGAHLSLL